MFLSGVQFRIRLDSRLKHAGMTIFGKEISLTQQAAGNMTRRDLNNARPLQKQSRFHSSSSRFLSAVPSSKEGLAQAQSF